MNRIFLALAVTAVALAPMATAQAAGDAAAGKKLARKCQTCHGLDGMSKLPVAPNIGGQPEQYLEAQMKAFRDGARVNDMMTVVMKDLTDQEIADLVAWFAAIKVTATLPAE